MNILLTGSGGFIGRNILERRTDKHIFLTPRSTDLNLMNSKAVDDFFREHKIDLIIHSASCGVRISPDATKEAVAIPNMQMFDNLARHVSSKCRMITFGSGAEYDKSRPITRAKESDFGQSIPQDPYGYSKYKISEKIQQMDNVLNLRIFGIYGKYENPTRFTTYAVKRNLERQPIEINQNVVFHFLDIDDFCRLLDFFIENPVSEKFVNLCPTESIDLVSLSQLVNENSDFKSKITIKKDGLNNEYTGCNDLLLKMIHGFVFTSYKDGLKKLKFFFMENQS